MKIFFSSLGCDKNLVDSEVMLGRLSEAGYTFTDDEDEAEAVVINTCCFIHDAKEESINTILHFAERKKQGKLKTILVTGCLAQRYKDEIRKEIPEVDAILGTLAIDSVVKAMQMSQEGAPADFMEDINRSPIIGKKRINTTGGYFAYLKIAEGCDKHCTYCIIPKVRGSFRSVPQEELIEQAKELAEQGIKELILVAQETTVYGTDLYGKKTLPELLKELCKINDLHWIRLMYCYPEELTEELLQTIKDEPKICHYLDIPIQHASDTILKRMGRRTTQQEIRDIVEKARELIPDICLRTTLITGFPGETKEDFEETYRFVNEMEFDRLGVFTYSPEEDTPAAKFDNQIQERVKKKRRNELMELQQEIAFEKAASMKGTVLEVMIEGKIEEDSVYVARTYKDAPDVDGYVFVNTDRDLMSGDFVKVVITGSHDYDMIGEIEDESAK